jgi:hypothetical protein
MQRFHRKVSIYLLLGHSMSSAINYLHTQLNYIADIPFNTLSYTNSLTFANFQGPWNAEWLSLVCFCLPYSFELDLSHTSILYYSSKYTTEIFECWSQVVSQNKKSFTLIRYSVHYHDSTLWHAALEQGVINAAK